MKYITTVQIKNEEGRVIWEHSEDTDADRVIELLTSGHEEESTALGAVEKTEQVRRGRPPAEKKTEKRGGPRGCKKCGKTGHMQKTCPENQTRTFDSTEGKKSLDEQERAFNSFKPPMTQAQYNQCRARRTEGTPSMVCASEMKMPIKSVNFAYQATTYDAYRGLERREAGL